MVYTCVCCRRHVHATAQGIAMAATVVAWRGAYMLRRRSARRDPTEQGGFGGDDLWKRSAVTVLTPAHRGVRDSRRAVMSQPVGRCYNQRPIACPYPRQLLERQAPLLATSLPEARHIFRRAASSAGCPGRSVPALFGRRFGEQEQWSAECPCVPLGRRASLAKIASARG